MSFTATPQGPTAIDLQWNIYDQSLGAAVSITITQTQWVSGFADGPSTVQTSNGDNGSLSFTDLLPNTTYNYQLDALWNEDEGAAWSLTGGLASLQLLVAATTTTGFTDVTDQPLVFNAVYVPKGSYQQITTNVQDSLVSSLIPSAVSTILAKTLGNLFNEAWITPTKQKDDSYQSPWQLDTALAVKIVYQRAAANNMSVSNVTAVLPQEGTVSAQATSAVSSGVPGSLKIMYSLPGVIVNFDYGWDTASYQLTYDAALVVASPVPFLPLTLTPKMTITASNAQLSAENVAADFNDLGEALAQMFSAGFFGFNDTAESRVSSGVDMYSSLTDIPAVDEFIAVLSLIGDEAQAAGFTQLTANIINGALTFGFVHPTDPAPVLYSPVPSLPDGYPLAQAMLALNVGAGVRPGESITVVGSNFPAQSATELKVAWANTSSGAPSGAELTYGIPLMGAANFETVSYLPPGNYEFTAIGLEPKTVYEFLACCDDQYTSSAWSNALVLLTAATDVVDLILSAASQPTILGPNIGSHPLSSTFGSWLASATIPANTKPGDYVIAAELAGEILATVPVAILGTQPVLHVIGNFGNGPTIILPPINLIGGETFSVQGLGFAPGAVVLALSGQPGTLVASANSAGEFTFNLIAPGDKSTSGPVTVTATGSNGSASVTVIELGVFNL